ncbi:ferrochelatase [Luteimonas sp. SX5]|uniref:Ferrochelatase n=1 Tax=Luteimonas galliterrae TaxID=2940486 RepID=A0ABT0MN64_9GAMM|nr:ferrochelatase [Luteimonas galliterrae]MCL1636128.1 ferrochelatase [Luteimonas galliterrae]
MPASPSTALLLVNLGTPEAPTARAVRRYLAEFLHDRRVVQLTRWLWCPLLHFAILPLRGPKVARKYAQIWMEGGSPLAVYTQRLAAAVQQRLPQWHVAHAMRYGRPAIAEVLDAFRREGVRRVVVLPLYPQYSTTTTASVADALAKAGAGLQVRMIERYDTDPAWVAAVADSIRAHRAAHGAGKHLLFSFHGLPQRLADRGDPYPQQCEASARAIAAGLGLADGEWSLSYQSRFGRERWLQPATLEALDALAARGVDTVDAVCPGFAVDCLETLEEVAMMLAARYAARGGTLRYIPCLNDALAHADALAALAARAAETDDA